MRYLRTDLSMTYPLYVIPLLLSVCLLGYRRIKDARNRYPPSPKRHWLLGNLFDLPRSIDRNKLLSWRHNHGRSCNANVCAVYTQGQHLIGNITYLSAFGQSIVVLNTAEAIKELLDRRARNFSDRPQTVVAGELMGLNEVSRSLYIGFYSSQLCVQTIATYDYTDRLRGLRKVVQQALSQSAVQKYQSLQLEAIKAALESFRTDPIHFLDHCQV